MKQRLLALLVGLLIMIGGGCGETNQPPTPQPTDMPDTPTPLAVASPTVDQEERQDQGRDRDQGRDQDTPVPPVLQGAGGNLIMTLGYQDPPTLDPALVGDTTSAFVVNQIFSGLVRLDENLDVQPDLAERWTISDDGRTYTFILRENARFANETPITSEDVRYSLERATDPTLAPSLPARTYLSDIVGVRDKLEGRADTISGLHVVDERTISLTIDAPKSYFLSKLVHPTAYVVDRRVVEQGGDTWTEAPNGSGTFAIEEWRHDQILVLKRNTNYYGDLARLDRVTMLMGAAASNPLVLYEQGKIDITEVSSYALARVQDESNPLSQELRSVPQLSISYIGLNVTVPPFDDVRVRRAFSLLIDRQRLNEVTLHESVKEARGILPPGMPGYNPDLPPLEVDIDRARSLLAESNYADNMPQIDAYGGGWTTLVKDIIEEEELDIPIEIRSYQRFGEFLAVLQGGEPLPMYSLAWIADYPDPENFLDVLFRSGSLENYADYSNAEVDQMLDEAAREQDEARRWQLYQQIEQRILEDMPLIPIYHDVAHVLVKPYVRGLVVTPMGILDLSTVELVR